MPVKLGMKEVIYYGRTELVCEIQQGTPAVYFNGVLCLY